MNPQQQFDVSLLALVIWREASDQEIPTKYWVAWSIRNRVNHPTWWGTDWPSVITHRAQYSSMTIPGDPNLIRWPIPTDTSWQAALAIAQAVYDGQGSDPTSGATSYHNSNITAPWDSSKVFIAKQGAFNFYRES